jgi:hypothetical protein
MTAPDGPQFYQLPNRMTVHLLGRGLVTRCGLLVVDLFATYEAGQMLMRRTVGPATCKRCQR